jgi:hypothetical protein
MALEPPLQWVNGVLSSITPANIDVNAVHKNDTGTQNIASHISMAATKKIQLTANDISGSIQRLIEFHSTNAEDRPWLSWFDEGSRQVAASGYHTKLADSLGGDILKQFEVKTIASATGPNPTDMRTRFAIQTDVERGTWGVNYIDNFEINQAENPILTTPGAITPAGLRIRLASQDPAAAGAGTTVCAQFLVQVDGTDNVAGFIDVIPPYRTGGTVFPGNKAITLSLFRNTNSASATNPQFIIKKGDGTNTNTFVFTAQSGTLTMTGPLGINGSAAPAKPTVTGAKGSNAALASLLTALVSYGFITDSTTA